MKADSLDAELKAVKVVYEALVNLGENGRLFVLKTVADRLGTTLPPIAKPADANPPAIQIPPGGSGSASPAAASHVGTQTPKEFIKAKRPVSEVQRVVCLAYYLSHFKKQPNFKTKELTELNSVAGENDFADPATTVNNAVNHHEFLAKAIGTTKRITNLGESVVEALPDQEKVKAVLSERRKPRKKRTKKPSTAK